MHTGTQARGRNAALHLQVCERWRRGISVLHAVGCLAEVRRLRRDASGAMQAVCRGAQRVCITSVAGACCCFGLTFIEQMHSSPALLMTVIGATWRCSIVLLEATRPSLALVMTMAGGLQHSITSNFHACQGLGGGRLCGCCRTTRRGALPGRRRRVPPPGRRGPGAPTTPSCSPTQHAPPSQPSLPRCAFTHHFWTAACRPWCVLANVAGPHSGGQPHGDP